MKVYKDKLTGRLRIPHHDPKLEAMMDRSLVRVTPGELVWVEKEFNPNVHIPGIVKAVSHTEAFAAVAYDKEQRVFSIKEGTAGDVSAVAANLLDQNIKRTAPGKLEWAAPDPSFLSKMFSYGSAKLSGAADQATFEERMQICMTCPALDQFDGKVWCGACGCGRRDEAELNTKLAFGKASCPLKRF